MRCNKIFIGIIVIFTCILTPIRCYAQQFDLTCDDVEKITIFDQQQYILKQKSTAEANGEHINFAQENEILFIPFFFLHQYKAQSLLLYIADQRGLPVAVNLNGEMLFKSSNYYNKLTEEQEDAYKKSILKSKTRWFNGSKSFPSYEEALNYAEEFCPHKVVRGKDKVLTEWPK